MQLRLIPAALIYFGSYLPLSVILLIQDLDFDALSRPVCPVWEVPISSCYVPFEHPLTAGGFVLFCTICFCMTLFVLGLTKPKRQIKIIGAQHKPADLMNYVLPYVVSFMSLDFSDPQKFAGFIVFLLWIFWITYKSGHIILNPVLSAIGWRLYEVDYGFEGSKNVLSGDVLSKVQIRTGDVRAFASVQDVLVVKS